jgi:hypothetical protein
MLPIDDITNLQGLREELRLQAHLFKKEVKDTFDSLENRWRDLEAKLPSLDKASISDLMDNYRRLKNEAFGPGK